jgi:tight adherence protein B
MFIFVAFIIFSVAMFGAAYYVWHVPHQEAEQLLAGRLRELRTRTGGRSRTSAAPDLFKREKRGSLASMGDFFAWLGILRRLQTYIDQANLKYRAAEVFTLCLIIFVVVFFGTGIFIRMVFLRLLMAALLGAIPIMYIRWVRAKRLTKFEEQLPDAIDLFNRSMRAGHNIHSGLETIAHESFDPIKMEFRKVLEELALGSQVDAALHNLGGRVPLIDLKFFITGLILQRQTGANMVQVLENLSMLTRERLNLAAKLKAATAQQRLSAGLLCSLPIVVGIGFWFLKPEYIRLLYTDEIGSKFLTYAIISEIVGILVIRKLANPKL